jgi:hypothetical protein
VVNRLAPLMGGPVRRISVPVPYFSPEQADSSKSQLPLRKAFLTEKAFRYAFLNLADTDRSLRVPLPTQLGVVPIHASLQKARLPSRAFFASDGSLCNFDTTCGSPTHFKNHPADVNAKSEYCEGCTVGALAPTTAPVGTLVWQVQTVFVRSIGALPGHGRAAG